MKTTGVLVIALLTFCITHVSAKTWYDKDVRVAQLGVGIGGLGGGYGTSSIPVISVGLDFGLTKEISVGGIAGYSSSKFDGLYGFQNSRYSWKYTYITLGARGSYHFLQVPNEKLDLYAGLGLGFNIVSSKYDGTAVNQALIVGASGSYMFLGIHAGARYSFSGNFAVYGELGYGLGILNVGIALKV